MKGLRRGQVGRGGLSALRLDGLLASSSVAALLIGGGAPQAFAAGNTSYLNTTAAGCTNSGAITGIAINNSTITGTVSNSGTISPNGIVLRNGIAGGTGAGNAGIVDSDTIPGTVGGGISRAERNGEHGAGSLLFSPPERGRDRMGVR